jgi:hypothetical protein
MVAHRFEWIRSAAKRYGLEAAELKRPPLTRHGQVWARVRRSP